jgi:hypothetical protein
VCSSYIYIECYCKWNIVVRRIWPEDDIINVKTCCNNMITCKIVL